MLSKFFLLAYTLGPAAAIPYAQGMMNLTTIFIVLFIAYTAPLPPLFFLLDRFHYETASKDKLIHRILNKPLKEAQKKKYAQKIFHSFSSKWGYAGFYLGLIALAFTVGFLWAALIAYLLKLPRTRSFLAIGIGNIMGLLFWIFVIVESKAFINPEWIIIIVLSITVVLFLYGEVRERKILEKLRKKISIESQN